MHITYKKQVKWHQQPSGIFSGQRLMELPNTEFANSQIFYYFWN